MPSAGSRTCGCSWPRSAVPCPPIWGSTTWSPSTSCARRCAGWWRRPGPRARSAQPSRPSTPHRPWPRQPTFSSPPPRAGPSRASTGRPSTRASAAWPARAPRRSPTGPGHCACATRPGVASTSPKATRAVDGAAPGAAIGYAPLATTSVTGAVRRRTSICAPEPSACLRSPHRPLGELICARRLGRDVAIAERPSARLGATPDLPDDPSPEQVQAWLALAELVQDPDFRASVRRMADYQAAERADGDRTGLHHDLTVYVHDTVTRAIEEDIAPQSPDARPVLEELVSRYAQTFGALDSAAYRLSLLRRLEVANDPRAEQYWQLLGTINGWPAQPTLSPIFDWFTGALRAHPLP